MQLFAKFLAQFLVSQPKVSWTAALCLRGSLPFNLRCIPNIIAINIQCQWLWSMLQGQSIFQPINFGAVSKYRHFSTDGNVAFLADLPPFFPRMEHIHMSYTNRYFHTAIQVYSIHEQEAMLVRRVSYLVSTMQDLVYTSFWLSVA
jgi:hypothetical protein